MPNRIRLALIAFAFHAPGLRLLTGFRLNRNALVLNFLALLLTLVAMGLAVARESAWPEVLRVWLAGHLAWSFCLSLLVSLGLAGEREPDGS